MTRRARLLLPLAGGAVLLITWQAAVAAGVRPYLLPPPAEVAGTFARLPGYLLEATRVTAMETGLGFILAAGIGIALGTLLAASRPVAAATMPLLVAGHALPKVALAPLLVVTLGFGPEPKVVMVVLVCTFPVVLGTATGLACTPAELVELTRSLDASWWQTLRRLRMPAALPHIFVGLKQAAPLAVVGAVVGELFGSTVGLGYTVRAAGTDTALVAAALLLLAAMSIALYYALAAGQQLLAPWISHTA